MIVKVKEPLPQEYPLLRHGQILFSYSHLTEGRIGGCKALAEALIQSGVIAIAYEMIRTKDGFRPLLAPMSKIAGHLSVILGAYYLQIPMKGQGTLIGRIPGIPPAEVVILGGGTVGTSAAKTALALGANVTIIEKDVRRLYQLNDLFGNKVTTVFSNEENIREGLRKADLFINAVFCYAPKFGHSPPIITKDMICEMMKKGAVFVDVATDEAIVEIKPSPKPFMIGDVTVISIPNLPSRVARVATPALANAILPYVMEVADKGWFKAVKENPDLLKGLNFVEGKVVNKEVAISQELEYYPIKNFFDKNANV